MTKKELIKRDADIIDSAMKNYTGAQAAHFGVIAYDTGERQMFAGGNTAIMGLCLSEAIATMICSTPGIGEEFIDAVAETAKAMLKDRGPVQ